MWSSAHPNLPANSLRTGNLTGNFSGFGPFGRFSCPIDEINQRLAPKFPEHSRKPGIGSQFQCVTPQFPEMTGTGNFLRGTGNFFDGTGNSFSLIDFMESMHQTAAAVARPPYSLRGTI